MTLYWPYACCSMCHNDSVGCAEYQLKQLFFYLTEAKQN